MRISRSLFVVAAQCGRYWNVPFDPRIEPKHPTNDGQAVRGALLAKVPDSSLGEVHKGSCSEDIHMEEEKVEVKIQEEVEDRERRGSEQSEDRRENRQSLRRMTHGWDDTHTHLSQCRLTHHYKCALWTRKSDVWSVLFTPPISCSRLPSTVQEATKF